MVAPSRIPYVPTSPPRPADLSGSEAIAAPQRDTHHTPAVPSYVPARAYAVPEMLLRARDPSGLGLAYWLTLARLGHAKGGTTITDAHAAQLLHVTPLRIARARNVLIDCDLVHISTRGRATLRRAKHDPDSFVSLSYLLVDEMWAGAITPAAVRQHAVTVDKRAEPGAGAGCGLTAVELAKSLGVRVDSIAVNDRQLVAAGLLRIEARPGAGKIRVPLHAHAVTRRISATARYALAHRRRLWRLPRPGTSYPQAALSKVSALRTSLPNRDRTSLPNREQSVSPPPVEPLVKPGISPKRQAAAFNDEELTSSGVAAAPVPWDVDGAVWQPSNQPQPTLISMPQFFKDADVEGETARHGRTGARSPAAQVRRRAAG